MNHDVLGFLCIILFFFLSSLYFFSHPAQIFTFYLLVQFIKFVFHSNFFINSYQINLSEQKKELEYFPALSNRG